MSFTYFLYSKGNRHLDCPQTVLFPCQKKTQTYFIFLNKKFPIFSLKKNLTILSDKLEQFHLGFTYKSAQFNSTIITALSVLFYGQSENQFSMKPTRLKRDYMASHSLGCNLNLCFLFFRKTKSIVSV